MEGRELFLVAIQVLLLAVVVTGATTDLVTRKIPNWVTYPGIAFGLTLAYAHGDTKELESSLLGLAVGGGILWIAWLSGGVKAGDWKLIAAVGAIKGYPFILLALWYSSLFGCAFALGFLAYHGRLMKGVGHSLRKALFISTPPVPESDPVKQRIQFGLAIALGTMLAWALQELGTRSAGGPHP